MARLVAAFGLAGGSFELFVAHSFMMSLHFSPGPGYFVALSLPLFFTLLSLVLMLGCLGVLLLQSQFSLKDSIFILEQRLGPITWKHYGSFAELDWDKQRHPPPGLHLPKLLGLSKTHQTTLPGKKLLFGSGSP